MTPVTPVVEPLHCPVNFHESSDVAMEQNGTEVFETKSEKNQQVAAESPRHNSEKQHVFNGLYMISVVGSRAPPVISQSSYAKAPFLGEILTWPGPHSRHRSASG